MRIVTIILSIYILGLSFVTCSDNEAIDITSDTIEHVHETDHHSDSGILDMCSPFCSCQCCHININTVDFVSYDLLTETHFKPVYSYQDTKLQDFNYSLFQPPRA